ncbi:EamA family transporter [Psychromonas arctica]|uniref:EamA family transporter n=1 Tax=Psychromonas arctica TaxID=168275 RepID=A0ABU9HFW1_9GAMM
MNVMLAMLAAFLWGTTYAVTQYSLPGWPPLLLGAIRALPAGLLLLAFKPSMPEAKYWPILVRLGSINIALFFGLLFIMAQTLPSAISGVGMVSLPVFAMFYYWLLHKKKPSKIQFISGMTLITLAWLLFDPLNLTLNPVGLIAMIAALASIVVGSNIIQGLKGKMHWWSVLCWQLIIGGSILTIIAFAHALSAPTQYLSVLQNFTSLNAMGLIWLVLLNTMLAYGLYVWLMTRMTVVEFTFAGISNPVAGILMGLILVGDQFTLNQYLLMALIIATSLIGSLLSTYYERKKLKESKSSH